MLLALPIGVAQRQGGARLHLSQQDRDRVLKALSVGAKACSGGRLYLYALAAAGQAGVEKTLENFREEIERAMKLMGARSVADLGRDNLRYR